MSNISEETRNKWKEKLTTIEEALNYGCLEINTWEEGFLNSIHERVFNDKDITFNQSTCLNRIYEKIS